MFGTKTSITKKVYYCELLENIHMIYVMHLLQQLIVGCMESDLELVCIFFFVIKRNLRV